MDITTQSNLLSHKVIRLSHLDLAGGGQVVVHGTYAYVGHMDPPHGTTIIDVSDPTEPRIVAEIMLDGNESHSHKVRVVGDLMFTNAEHNNRAVLARGQLVAASRIKLRESLKREPTNKEMAEHARVNESEVERLEAYARTTYEDGGFKIWDISNRGNPRLLVHQRTGGIGVHRFDVDHNYAYISTEMAGFQGNILVIYDLADPRKPQEASRWWMPGQNVAAGETPTWRGKDHRLHHALRSGNTLWAGCWYGGARVIDISDITQPRTIGSYTYPPPVHQTTHTFLRVPFKIDGRDIAVLIDEEHDSHRGQPHAHLWVTDVTDLNHIQAIGQFHVSEMDSPYSRKRGRFGAHQFQEHMRDTRVYCTWFSGGLRIVDIANPRLPEEIGWYIPEPVAGNASPQSNDVEVDERGLIYLLDRNCGFDILQFNP